MQSDPTPPPAADAGELDALERSLRYAHPGLLSSETRHRAADAIRQLRRALADAERVVRQSTLLHVAAEEELAKARVRLAAHDEQVRAFNALRKEFGHGHQ